MDQELVQYLDERFGRIEQRLDAHDERFDEVKRHTGVLVEGLRQQVDAKKKSRRMFGRR